MENAILAGKINKEIEKYPKQYFVFKFISDLLEKADNRNLPDPYDLAGHSCDEPENVYKNQEKKLGLVKSFLHNKNDEYARSKDTILEA